MKAGHFILFFSFFILFMNSVSAEIKNSDYYFIVGDNGNTIAGITFYGSGEITLPVPQDVRTLNVEGGLYIMENNTITISIGSTEKAVLAYQTNLFTEKSGKDWKFSADFEKETEKEVIVAMPEETIINDTKPLAISESGNFIKLKWENPESVEIDYSFPEKPLEKNSSNYFYYIIAGGVIIFASALFYFMNKRNKNKISGRQEQLLRTLTDNERKIIELLLGSKNPVKRSFLGKKLELAKSSLAATINNLERKKIIEIDRLYSSHFIKLAEWFRKL